MNRKAVSQIVTIILMVLLVLASIVILWNVVKKTVEEKSGEVDIAQFTVNLEIDKKSTVLGDGKIAIRREAGKGDLTGIKIKVFNEDGDSEVISEPATINELETEVFDISEKTSLEVSYVEIYPVITAKSGKEIIGPRQDTIGKKPASIEYGDETQTCSAQGGDICGDDEYCPGNSLTASDTSKCCEVVCEIPSGGLCSNCGKGLFNLCDRTECGKIAEGCYFVSNLISGTCTSCSGAACSDYDGDETTCLGDVCLLGDCRWDGSICEKQAPCTDNDGDDYCLESESSGCDNTGICELGWDDCYDDPAICGANCNPGIVGETCDGYDNDCDGNTDENNADCSGGTPYCVSGSCVECINDVNCDDLNVCTENDVRICRGGVLGTCAGTNKPDGTSCSGGGTCQSGVCVIPVTACMDLTVENGYYKLNSPISSTTSTCFNILANGITLDFNAKTVTCGNIPGGTTGVSNNGYNNIKIKGGTLLSCGIGIYLENGEYNNITGMTIRGSTSAGTGHGIYLYSSNYSLIQGNTITRNVDGSGILFQSSSYNTIDGNTVGSLTNPNEAGISIDKDSGHNEFQGNIVCKNTFNDFNCHYESETDPILTNRDLGGNSYISDSEPYDWCDGIFLGPPGGC